LKREIAIFEEAENAEIGGERQHQEQRPPRLGVRAINPLRRFPVDSGRYHQQEDERRIPGPVEKITGDQEIEFLDAPRQWRAVQRYNNREKDHEGQ